MVMTRKNRRDGGDHLVVDNNTFERVDAFVYLGANVNSVNMVCERRSSRIEAGNRSLFARLAPCDFFLFPTIKDKMRGLRFDSAEATVEAYEDEPMPEAPAAPSPEPVTDPAPDFQQDDAQDAGLAVHDDGAANIDPPIVGIAAEPEIVADEDIAEILVEARPQIDQIT